MTAPPIPEQFFRDLKTSLGEVSRLRSEEGAGGQAAGEQPDPVGGLEACRALGRPFEFWAQGHCKSDPQDPKYTDQDFSFISDRMAPPALAIFPKFASESDADRLRRGSPRKSAASRDLGGTQKCATADV
jgi:hypothetical protein